MRLKSLVLLSGLYTCDVRNTRTHIEISNIKEFGRSSPKSPYEIRNDLLKVFKKPYSDIDTSKRADRLNLAKELECDIKLLEEEIEKRKLAIKMCKKLSVEFAK